MFAGIAAGAGLLFLRRVQFLETIGGDGLQAKRISTARHHATEGEL